jgi:hypothetical protein
MTNDDRKDTTEHTANPADAKRDDEVSSASSPGDTPEADSTKQDSASATVSDELEAITRALAAASKQADDSIRWMEAFKAEKSKRPKMKRKRTALTHGIYSDELAYPWESPADLEKLHEKLKMAWQPIGISQEEAVVELTYWHWLWRREMKMPQLALYRDPFSLGLLNSGKTDWQDIIDHQPTTCEVATGALFSAGSLLKALDVLAVRARRVPHAKASIDGGSPSDLGGEPDGLKLARAVEDMVEQTKAIEKLVRSWAPIVEENKNAFNQAYDPSVIDRQVRSLAAIEARIDKA